MGRKLTAFLVAGGLIALGGAAIAHHSFAMFDQENPIELAGAVQEFKFTSPHTFILLKVSKEGKDTVWNLEGASPSALVRDGRATQCDQTTGYQECSQLASHAKISLVFSRAHRPKVFCRDNLTHAKTGRYTPVEASHNVGRWARPRFDPDQ